MRYGSATVIEVQRAAVGARQHNRAAGVEQVQLLDALHGGDGLVADAACFGCHRLGDRRGIGEAVGRNLHHAARGVRHQQELATVLLVDDHVDRTVAVAELGDRRADDLRARLQAGDRKLDERRAQVAGDEMRRVVDAYGTNANTGERVSNWPWLPWKISTLVPLSTAANGYFTARSFEANSSFDRPAMYSRPSVKAMSVIDCCRGSRCGFAVPAFGAFGSATFVCFSPSNETTSILPAPSTRSSAGLLVGPLTAHHRDVGVLRARVHGHVGDDDLFGLGAEEGGNLLVDGLDALGAGGAARGFVAKLERKNRGRLASAANSTPSGPNVSGPMDVICGPTSAAPTGSGARIR